MALKQLDDTQQDERYNPSGDARDLFRQENDRDAFDTIANNYDKTADDTQENKNIEKLKDSENSPTGIPGRDGGWTTNVSGSRKKKQKVSLKGRFGKKGGIIGGLIALALGGGGIGAFLLSPSMMLIDLSERFTLHNDSASTAMERRMIKVFGAMNGDGEMCSNGKGIKCRLGLMSNRSLSKLNKKGLTPIFDDGSTYDGKKTGYPKDRKNPTRYRYVDDDGKEKFINAKDIKGFLLQKENRKIANKVFGRTGAFNMRLQAWTGKHINKFYTKFNIHMNGGLADGQNKKLSAADRLKAAKEKLKAKVPGMERISGVTGEIKKKLNGNVSKAAKGGSFYQVTVAGCMVAKAPSFIAAGVAAVQLAQIMPLVSELVLSPGSKAKASGVDFKNSITSDDMDTIGTLLTNKTKNADGKMTSALDSPYLLKALGTNTAKTPVSKKFTPGFGVLTNPAMVTLRKAQKKSEPACNVILSPAAMWSAAVVDGAATAIASATLVGGVVKVAAGFVISIFVSNIVGDIVTSTAEKVITSFAKNDDIPNAEGEELGDVLGLSAMAFFSAGGMNGNLPTLSESQVTTYQSVKNENIAFMSDLEKNEVSPFDINSRYTIPGSILANMRTAALQTGTYGTPLAIPAALISLPQLAFTKPAFAAETNDCTYAKDFGMDTGDPKTTPAINATGLPCTGITPAQAGMDTKTAVELLENEGWLDTEKPVADDATIDDLVADGVIKKDTPLSEFIESCSDASTGSYLTDSSGCIIQGGGKSAFAQNTATLADSRNTSNNYCGGEGEEYACLSELDEYEAPPNDMNLKNPHSLQAMSVFLIDYRIAQGINGEDAITGEESQSSNDSEDDGEETNESETVEANGDFASPAPAYTKTLQKFGDPVSYPTPVRSPSGGNGHNGVDLYGTQKSETIYAGCSGVIKEVTHSPKLNLQEGTTSNTIVINCGGGLTLGYHHSTIQGKAVGDTVRAGDKIGHTDSSGNWGGWHLHFTVKENGTFRDPVTYFKKKGIELLK